MRECEAELCDYWTGHGCICAALDIEPPEEDGDDDDDCCGGACRDDD